MVGGWVGDIINGLSGSSEDDMGGLSQIEKLLLFRKPAKESTSFSESYHRKILEHTVAALSTSTRVKFRVQQWDNRYPIRELLPELLPTPVRCQNLRHAQ